MRKILVLALVFILCIFIASAHGEETFAEAEELIQEKVPCDELTEDQLEVIGEYYMEQMHPGEQHEIMDEMMGGEGSESLRLMHINMARNFYCGEHEAMSSGMMNMMMGMMNYQNFAGGENMAYMMGGMDAGWAFYSIVYFIAAAFIFSVIFWLTYNWLAHSKKR